MSYNYILYLIYVTGSECCVVVVLERVIYSHLGAIGFKPNSGLCYR